MAGAMRVTVEGEEVDFQGESVEDLLSQLSINRETVLVKVNGELTPETARLEKGDSVEILEVVSSG